MTEFFQGIPKTRYEGSDSDFAYRHYDPDEVVMGKRMEDHLRFAVAWWHSFAWPGPPGAGAQPQCRWLPAGQHGASGLGEETAWLKDRALHPPR